MDLILLCRYLRKWDGFTQYCSTETLSRDLRSYLPFDTKVNVPTECLVFLYVNTFPT